MQVRLFYSAQQEFLRKNEQALPSSIQFPAHVMVHMSQGQRLNLVGNDEPALRIHDLIKAPENTEWSQEKKHSWDASEPATVYHTPEMMPDGTPTTAATVILRTKGCHWWWSSGCTFCGYFNDTRDDVESADLHAQWEFAKKKLSGFEGMDMVKVYTSGSLLEDREIPVDFQETVLRECHEMNKHLVIESRTEQCTEEKLSWAKSINPEFTVAIGLEAHDEEVLKFHVNKGFTLKSWKRAVVNLQNAGLRVKTYLMFKPPFMSEGDALEHCVKWIADVAEVSDEISVNPMNIQRGTIIDRLFRAKEYRPPWLWSLVELIERVNSIIHPKGGVNGEADQISRLLIHPTAGGRIRGSHNCGKCDKHVVAAIERYSVSGDMREFVGLDCACKKAWRTEIELDVSLPAVLGVGIDRRGDPMMHLRSP
jgi:radical SAM enzyme (TIGR01210 family)